MRTMSLRRGSLVVGMLIAVSLAQGGRLDADSQFEQTSYSGRATVVRATVLGVSTLISDTGPLPASGGAGEASLLEASVPDLLTAGVAHASTVGGGGVSESEASVANLTLTVGGNTISAGFLGARARAECLADGGCSAAGSSEIAELVINGQPIAVTGQPNQTVALPIGRVIINEQLSADDDRTCDITVNALHVVVDGVADVVISSAHADVVCRGPDACGGRDFVTGGGWILTPSGDKGTFGVAGGLKHGALWGHLTYLDHGSRLKVKATGVTDYIFVNATGRRIKGTAEINGQPGGTYDVYVEDNGEPGRTDRFELTLSNGYSAAGTLDGGNIQLHDRCR